MLHPKEISLPTQDGGTLVVILSKFPAIAGREIIAKYPLSAMPKLGDYAVNEETMLKLMAYVAIPRETGEPLALSTRALIDNHIPEWETLARIEIAMMEYNVSFFGNGKASGFLDAMRQKAQRLLSQTLTDLSERYLPTEKRRSTS